MKAFSLKACGRILWREAAEQYAFCIGIFAMLVTMQASLVTMETFDMIRTPTVSFGFGMALFMTAIYAAASSALLLTAEVDAGTFAFQRTKPIGWFTYLWGKLSWTVLSSILLGMVAWIETCIWLGLFPSAQETSLAFGVSGVGIVEGMAWGLVVSMLLRGPLRAVIAGIAMASLGAWITVVIHHSATGGGSVAVTAAYAQAAWPRLLVAIAVLTAGLPLARVWYRTGQPLRPLALPRFLRGDVRSVAVPGEWNLCDQPRRGRTIRLLWQAWRQIRTPAIVYWGLCLAVLVWAGLHYVYEVKNPRSSNSDPSADFLLVTSCAFLLLSSLLAGYTFGPDQKARFLQLARDGVSPWEIWLSRLAVMGAVLLPPGLIVFGLFSLPDELAMLRPLIAILVVLGFVSVLVIGQACSMLVRSRIIALLAAPVMTACFAFWIPTALLWAGLDWKLAAAPLLLALLIGSRVVVSTRLRQENSWRAMRLPALLVVVAVVVTYQGFAHHRVNEIRPYDSMIQADDRLIGASPERIVWYAERLAGTKATSDGQIEEALRLQGDASPSITLHRIRELMRQNSRTVFGRSTTPHVKTYGNMLMADAQLNRRLRDVSRRPDVRNEELRVCLDFLEDWGWQRSRRRRWLAADCQRDMAWLQYGPVAGYAGYGFYEEPLPWHYRWLSFERVRALQLLDRAYRIAVDRSEEYERAVINDQSGFSMSRNGLMAIGTPFGLQWRDEGLVTSQDIILPSFSGSGLNQGWNRMLLGAGGRNQFRLLSSLERRSGNRYDSLYTAESQRRGTILYLALRMYYNDHAELPGSLDALVEGKYLSRLPVVPIACKPFYYEPIGADEELNEAIQHVNTDKPMFSTRGEDISFLIEHDSTLPFLWYPFGPGQNTTPDASPGVFIDLDFCE